MDETQSRIVECVRAGASIVSACNEVDVPEGTVRRWLTNGRARPDGVYGPFARAVEAARVPVPEAFAGERLAEIEAVGASLDLADAGVRAKFGLARGLARKLDWCERTPTGAAAMAMANLAKMYQGVLVDLTGVSDGDMEWLAGVFAKPGFSEEFKS